MSHRIPVEPTGETAPIEGHSPYQLPQNPDVLLTESQVAQLTGLSIRTFQAYRLRGGGPRFIKLGRAVRYRQRDISQWIEESAQDHTGDGHE